MILDTIIYAIFGLLTLLLGANYLIRHIVILAKKLNISNFIIASCTLAFGTTIPELATSLKAILNEPSYPGIAVGNVIGSNIANIFLILGISSIIFPTAINFDKFIIKEQRINLLIILFPASIIFLNFQKNLSTGIAVVMLCALIFLIYNKINTIRTNNEKNKDNKSILITSFLLFLSLIAVIIGSDYLLDNTVKIAQHYNVPNRVIGLSILAVGTSLPELTTAIISALKKLKGVALGNVLGANAYNILGILSLVEIIEPSSILNNALRIDIYFLIIATIMLGFVLMKLKAINKNIGLIFVSIYILYIYLIY
jgi:cation:H+ antiporter